MRRIGYILLFTLGLGSTLHAAEMESGERLFKEYCWGCHHQTAEAFGPSFRTIANQRNKETIMAMMTDPAATSKALGYRRNSMPAFDDLTPEQKASLADYIMQFKDRK
jgi:mono/diheme cytochrome c family protein